MQRLACSGWRAAGVQCHEAVLTVPAPPRASLCSGSPWLTASMQWGRGRAGRPGVHEEARHESCCFSAPVMPRVGYSNPIESYGQPQSHRGPGLGPCLGPPKLPKCECRVTRRRVRAEPALASMPSASTCRRHRPVVSNSVFKHQLLKGTRGWFLESQKEKDRQPKEPSTFFEFRPIVPTLSGVVPTGQNIALKIKSTIQKQNYAWQCPFCKGRSRRRRRWRVIAETV